MNTLQKRGLAAASLHDLVSVDDAASMIGVSTATIRNWAKAGHLASIKARPLLFKKTDVLDLKNSIASGATARLRTRANKSTSSAVSIPTEYMADTSLLEAAEKITGYFHQKNGSLSLSAILFLASLRILELRGEVAVPQGFEGSDLSSLPSWRRSVLREEMLRWRSTIIIDAHHKAYQDVSGWLNSSVSSTDGDILGLIYQALVSEGNRSVKGAYYTPKNVVEESLQFGEGADSFLDPCCGTGQYLLRAARKLDLPLHKIFAFDNDEIAVRIARINLLLMFPDTNLSPNIHCLNTITDVANGDVFCATNNLIGTIDFIATNPPWGANKNTQLSNFASDGIQSNETFSLILAKAIKLLKVGGRLSFVLPESILKIKIHSDIRKFILERTRISKISHLGRQFSTVFTPVIRLDLIKQTPAQGGLVTIEQGNNVHQVEQERFFKNRHYTFDGNVTGVEDVILAKLDSKMKATLKGNADWALGIVTGNNKAFIKDQPGEELEPIFKGSDVGKYVLKNPSGYIAFTPSSFQQVAKTEFYRAPVKLIYKFISNKLMFAYDDRQKLTLNSANILIPRIPGISAKVTLAYLNSNLFQYIFMKRFSTHKVLRGDLETLPFPNVPGEVAENLERLVDLTLAGEDQSEKINALVYKTFDVCEEEICIIEKALL